MLDRLTQFISAITAPGIGPAIALGLVIVFLTILTIRLAFKPRQDRARYGRPTLVSRTPGPSVGASTSAGAGFGAGPSAGADPHAQMEAVRQAGFEPVRLLNKQEARLLPLLEATVREAGQGHRVMAQTSLGEVIRPVAQGLHPDLARQAYAAINSKRLDFAIFDRGGFLVCAIEYQGTGHYHAATFLRDAVNREALRKAGIHMLGVRPDFDTDRLKADLRPFPRPSHQAA